MNKIVLTPEMYGPLWPYINDDRITDVDWNGRDLWIEHLDKGRYKVEDKLDRNFLESFSQRIANNVNVNFNKNNPCLEAETDDLRISILHEEKTNTGRAITIRKTPATRRMSREENIQKNYSTEQMDNFIQNCVKGHLNIVISGLPGVGKTELIKYCTEYIPADEKVITIEDNYEIRYSKLNPDKNCIEIKVEIGSKFDYADAIKACLRQNPLWILLSEARSIEVKYLLESLSTGTHCITTIHSDDVYKIPSRILNMIGDIHKNTETDIYNFIDVGILVEKKVVDGVVHRKIEQICLYTWDEEKQKGITTMIFEKGKYTGNEIPEDIKRKFEHHDIPDPFAIERGECSE